MSASSGDRVRKHRAKLNEPVAVVQDHEPDTWAEAPRYIEAGYLAQPCYFHDMEAGESSPHVQWLPSDSHSVARMAECGVTVACNLELRASEVPTIYGTTQLLSWAPVPAIAALRLNIAQSHELAVEILETIVRPRLVWASDVTTRLMPVRSKLGSAELLIPLRVDYQPHLFDFTTWRYALPTDVQPANKYMPGPTNSASIRSTRECFLASAAAYRWSDGGIPAVPRAVLPMLASVADAHAVIQQINALLDKRGTHLTYTPIVGG
jgi:hypothetical protein